MDADHFEANCYSFSAAVCMTHYLLRQKPYRVMWGGVYIVMDDNLDQFIREEDLLGISTYKNYEDFELNNSDIQEKPYFDKMKRIEENRKSWNRINVYQEALSYFNYEQMKSVDYRGFLINHDKQMAVNLENYYKYSKYIHREKSIQVALDLIPVLTETGGGSRMAMFDGISAETTERLFGQWCGDLLQISDVVPDGYEIIRCCFADIWSRAIYCYKIFGTDDEHFVLDRDQKRYEAIQLSVFDDERSSLRYVQAQKTDKGISFQTAIVGNEI
jgi:hypothetical protein